MARGCCQILMTRDIQERIFEAIRLSKGSRQECRSYQRLAMSGQGCRSYQRLAMSRQDPPSPLRLGYGGCNAAPTKGWRCRGKGAAPTRGWRCRGRNAAPTERVEMSGRGCPSHRGRSIQKASRGNGPSPTGFAAVSTRHLCVSAYE